MKFSDIVFIVVKLLEVVVYALMSFALLVFLYGLTRYMLGAGDDSKREESRTYIIYGIIGLFVMVAMWGLVGVLTSTFIQTGGVGIPVLNVNSL